MKCPNCRDSELKPVMTKQGAEIDRCDSCRGFWLDEGELFLFAKKPMIVEEKIRTAIAGARPTSRRDPRTGTSMEEIRYPGGPKIDYSPNTGGMWFDAGEVEILLKDDKDLKMEVDGSAGGEPGKPGAPKPRAAGVLRRARRGVLLPLPNLFLRSAATLAGLYAVLAAVLIAAVEFAGVSLDFAVAIGVGIVLVQFLLSPFIMDLTLSWLYSMAWVDPASLPEHLRGFVDKLCRAKGVSFPRFGIIEDGAPQAFTYGHVPGNARIVISRGLLNLLNEKEAEAVVAHEIGHVVHWDMVLMTAAQLVPLLLYYVYRVLISAGRGRSRGGGKGGGQAAAVAVVAYVLYIVSEYVVLWFSRTREYHADRFAGHATGEPSLLASALVKIAYGLAGQAKKKDEKDAETRSAGLEAVGALGIFDAGAARSLAIAAHGQGLSEDGEVDRENVRGAMRWDLWNPWAKWYELNSTHPLVAHRLQYLSDQAEHAGKEPYVVFDEVQPESYWDEFLADLVFNFLPALTLLAGAAFLLEPLLTERLLPGRTTVGAVIAAFGLALLIRFRFVYRQDGFPKMSVAALLKKVKVSSVRPVACRLEGEIIGKGVPGLIWSEDFVMKDQTGIMFLDYRQPIAIFEFFFGLLRAGSWQGKKVVIEGWYRRAPVPYVELLSIRSGNDYSRCWVSTWYKVMALGFLIAGIAVATGVLP